MLLHMARARICQVARAVRWCRVHFSVLRVPVFLLFLFHGSSNGFLRTHVCVCVCASARVYVGNAHEECE